MSYSKMPSRVLVSQQDQTLIPKARVPRSVYRNQWVRKAAYETGYLYPILVQEMLPGDHVKYDMDIYLRMSTLIQPIMDQLRVDTHVFFTPNRLVWANWKKLMGEKLNPADTIAYTTPQMPLLAGGMPVGSLSDHMGIPTIGQIAGAAVQSVNALPFRMYNMIWNEWFRDENLNNAANVPTGDGPDAYTDAALLQRNKSQDYFTTNLAQPQNTSTGSGVNANGAQVPLQGVAPVTGIGTINQTFTAGPSATVYQSNLASTTYSFYKGPIDATGANNQILIAGTAASGYPSINAQLDGVPGFNINALRTAWAIQQLLELDNRGGTRYIEIIMNQFGVDVEDYRLQRPEYIGGGSSALNVTPIAQTSASTTTPLGQLGAAATVSGRHTATYACKEHGYVIAVLSIKSELTYQQGTARHWYRTNRLNYYTPALADLGDQSTLMRELYTTAVPANDDIIFGYQERWQEYRTVYSEAVGLMRSTAASTIDNWHLGQKFLAAPTLSGNFIQDIPPMQRILAAGAAAANQQFVAEINYNRTIARPMPTYSIPATLGRF